MAPGRRNETCRPALSPPPLPGDCSWSFCHLGRPLPASAVPPSVRGPRAGWLPGSASRETSRIVGEIVHATLRSWDRTRNKRAGYRAPGRTNSCKARCHHRSRTGCSGTWPWLNPIRKKGPRPVARSHKRPAGQDRAAFPPNPDINCQGWVEFPTGAEIRDRGRRRVDGQAPKRRIRSTGIARSVAKGALGTVHHSSLFWSRPSSRL